MGSAEQPYIEATSDNRVRIAWEGQSTPQSIDGLKVSYCNDGMLWLGPIETPVRFRRITHSVEDGPQKIEMELSMAGLRMLGSPSSQPVLTTDASQTFQR